MKNLTVKQLSAISGGWNYTPPENPDKEPLRAGLANQGGYVNYALKEYVGIDITGDNPEHNKLLGIAAFIPPMALMTAAIIKIQNAILA